MDDLAGKVCVVTGAANGIGRGMADAFAARGAHLVLVDIAEEELRQAARELGEGAIAVQADVIEASALERVVEEAYAAFGRVDVLCNNAGVFVGGPVAETPVNDLAWMMAVNFFGVVHGVQAFLPRFRAQGGEAHIVNTGSVSGLYPTPNQGAYAASKYAVVGYSERLREELGAEGIGVSILCPAGVRTRIGSSKRVRQEQFGGPVPPPTVVPPRPATDGPQPLDPREVGELVVQGILENRLYIHTQAEGWPERYRERFEEIDRDFALLR